MSESYTVKTIAERMQMSPHAIRFYTDHGLCPCRRDINGHRIFGPEAINWLEGVKCLKHCGTSIEDIQAYGQLCRTPNSLESRYQFMKAQLEKANARLAEAQSAVDYLHRKLKHYEDILAGRAPDDTNPRQTPLAPCD